MNYIVNFGAMATDVMFVPVMDGSSFTSPQYKFASYDHDTKKAQW